MTEAKHEPNVANADYIDLVVVSEDANNLVVQVKNTRGRAIRYALPRRTLDVVFTSTGIQRTADDEGAAPRPQAEGADPPRAGRAMVDRAKSRLHRATAGPKVRKA